MIFLNEKILLYLALFGLGVSSKGIGHYRCDMPTLLGMDQITEQKNETRKSSNRLGDISFPITLSRI